MLDLIPSRRGTNLRALLLSQVAAAALLTAGGGGAMAQSLPSIQTLPTTTAGIDAITPGVTSVYAVPVDQIDPTQPNVGDSEIAKKTADWNLTPASQLQASLLGEIEPVVIGPGGVLYQTDGQHTFLSLQDSIYGPSDPTVYVDVIANYSNDTPAQFVQDMETHGQVYPVNNAVPFAITPTTGDPLSPIPTTLQNMTNDPYRGLEYSVLKNKFPGGAGVGFDKVGTDYADFLWADTYQAANGGLGLAYASPGDANAAAVYSQNGSNPAFVVGVTSPTAAGTTTSLTVGQLPGFILAKGDTLNPDAASPITNATLAGGALAPVGTTGGFAFNGLNGLYLNQGGTTVVLEPAQPGFVMQLGNDNGASVVLSNGSNSYTGGTTIIAGDLVTAINVGPGGKGDALGAAPTGGTINLSDGNLLVQSSVQATNGIVFDSLTEGNGTLTFGTNTAGSSNFTEARNIAIGSEQANINTNGNVVTLTGQIATSNIGSGGYAALTLDDTAKNPGTLILAPTAPQGNSGFFGNVVITSGTLQVANDADLGNNVAANGPIGAIDLDGGTFQAGGNISSSRSVFLTGGSTLDTNGYNSTFGALTDVQRTLTVTNSNGSTTGSATFASLEVDATATLKFTGSNKSTITFTGGITRDPNATFFLTTTSKSSLGGTTGLDHVFSSGASTVLNDGSSGIVAPWIVQDNGTNYNFVTYSATTGYAAATTANGGYTSTSILTSGKTDVVSQSANASVANGAAASALALAGSKTITISGGKTLTLGDGSDPAGLILNGGAAINGGTLAFGGSEAVISVDGTTSKSIGSAITGTGGLTLAGAGILTLTGAATYSGATTVDSGTLALTTANELADTSGVMLMDNKSNPSAAILALSASQTFAALNSAGNNSSLTLSNGASLTIGTTSGAYANESSAFSGSIAETDTVVPTGGAAIIKAGSGLLDLTGESKNAIQLQGGSISVTGGQLRIASNLVSGTTTINLAGGTELQFDQGGGGAFGSAITGSGDVRLLSGTLQLTGANSYKGGTFVEWGGVLDTTTSSIPGNITASGTVVFDQNFNGTYSGVIADGTAATMLGSAQSANFVKDDSSGDNSGNVTFANAQTYSGTTTVEAGTLTLGATNTIGSSSSVDLGRIGGGATASLSLGANNLVNALNSEEDDTTNVALNGYTLTVNEGAGQQSTYRGTVSDTGGGAVVKTGAGTLNLAGPSGGGGPNTIAGSVSVNQGTLALSGNLDFTGTVTVNASLASDPATLTFGNLDIGMNGSIHAAPGDVYDVLGDFINHSTQSMAWNTSGATLQFTGGTTHEMTLTTPDMGKTWPIGGVPFAWGALDLGMGDMLDLADGLTGPGPVALYVGDILGLDLSGDEVTNIMGDGADIYYESYLAENAYLDGGTYQLEGGGELIAEVPEPGSLSLLLTGLLGVALRRRRPGPRRA